MVAGRENNFVQGVERCSYDGRIHPVLIFDVSKLPNRTDQRENNTGFNSRVKSTT